MKKKLTLKSITGELSRHIEESLELNSILLEHEFLTESLDSRLEDLMLVLEAAKKISSSLETEMRQFIKS
jgi:hypothetical protein